MCEVLNTFFRSMFTNEFNSMNMPEVIRVFHRGCDEIVSDIMVNEYIVVKKLVKLNKASGLLLFFCFYLKQLRF